jgi:hypothetical protein
MRTPASALSLRRGVLVTCYSSVAECTDTDTATAATTSIGTVLYYKSVAMPGCPVSAAAAARASLQHQQCSKSIGSSEHTDAVRSMYTQKSVCSSVRTAEAYAALYLLQAFL